MSKKDKKYEREEARKFIEELREKKLSVLDVFGIVERKAENSKKVIRYVKRKICKSKRNV